MFDEYPTVQRWLASAEPDHPWKGLLADPSQAWGRDRILRPLEVILTTLEAAGPERLSSKRTAFGKDSNRPNVLNLRAELLFSYLLVGAGCPFAFGGIGEPDLCCRSGPDDQFWIEVTTRDRDDLRKLRDELETKLAELSVHVTLHIPGRLMIIQRQTRDATCARVLEGVANLGDDQGISVALPEVGGHAQCSRMAGVPSGGVLIDNSSSDLTDHAAAVERALLDVLVTKTAQAARGEWDPMTLLVVDMSRAGLSWMRPEAVWPAIFARLELDWSTLPFAGVVVGFSSLTSLTMSGTYFLRPTLTLSARRRLAHMLVGLGFSPGNSGEATAAG